MQESSQCWFLKEDELLPSFYAILGVYFDFGGIDMIDKVTASEYLSSLVFRVIIKGTKIRRLPRCPYLDRSRRALRKDENTVDRDSGGLRKCVQKE